MNNEFDFKFIKITAISCAIEINNASAFYCGSKYDVYLNQTLMYEGVNKNVISIFSLTPNTSYELKVVCNNKEIVKSFITEKVSKVTTITNEFLLKEAGNDLTNKIQAVIDSSVDNELIVFQEGVYHLRPLFLKSNITLEIKKGAILLGSTERSDYPVLKNQAGKIDSSWEGTPEDTFASLITGLNVENISIIGEGIIDGNAQNADWWENPKEKIIAYRPKTIYFANSKNVLVQGVNVQNSPSWTIHPFYSSDISLLNVKIKNPKISPNTDGINPENCENVQIIGCEISVGDDCIALKSGKLIMAQQYYRPTSKVTIRNCKMKDGHGAVVLGSEIACGIKELFVSQCVFEGTDRGIRIKTRRGRGNLCNLDNLNFENIYMDKVLNPFVINMYYNCDKEGKSEYVQSKTIQPVDELTPYIGSITFKHIRCDNAVVSAGFFYGLPENPIGEIKLIDIDINFENSRLFDYPAMMNDIERVNRLGLYFNNVRNIKLMNVRIKGFSDEMLITKNVSSVETQ